MGLKILILSFFIFIVSLCIGVSAYIASSLTTPGDTPINFDKNEIGRRNADITFKSKDNIQLAGWYYRGTNDKAIIFVHGAGNQNRVNEAYGTPEIAKHFYDAGYTLLLFDLRGIGESQKTRMSFGLQEANDVAGAFDYLIAQEFEPKNIGIIGDSLGAIATIMASRDVKNAGAIVLDSPATEIREIVSHLMQNEHNVPRFMHPGVFLTAKLFYKVDIDKVRPIDVVLELSATPTLFLHGDADTLIAPEHSKRLAESINAKRVTFPNAGHVETFLKNKEQYLKLLDDFFEENLK